MKILLLPPALGWFFGAALGHAESLTDVVLAFAALFAVVFCCCFSK